MQTLLLTLELVIAILLIVFILLQRSEGGALGIGGGGGGGLGGLFSPRGAADTLTRTTAYLAVGFFVVCLALNILVARTHRPASILDVPTSSAPAQKAPVQKAPSGPTIPTPH